MNKITIIIFALLISSCCGAKEVVKTLPKESEEIAQIITPETPETPKVIEAPVVEPPKELEAEVVFEEPPMSPQPGDIVEDIEIAEAFDHSTFNALLQKHVSSQGNVNYNSFKTDKTNLQNYIASLGENMPNKSWAKEDKIVYWINAYNAMTIDLILRNPSVKSIKEIKDPWDQRLWKLADKWYNLNQIEHDILRKMNEPRIHFAIVCASVSCPKLQNTAFTASDLEIQLTNATKEFLSDSSKNNLSKNSIKLSKIFKWFAKDFKQNQSLVDFLNKYSDIEISQNASKNYMDYNWNLND